MKLIFTSIIFFSIISLSAQNRERAFEINSMLGRGINFGNMFEAPSETEWGNPWMPDYPRMVASLGFNHIRIPIRWEPSARSLASSPYTINPIFLARIKQVVDSCLNNGVLAVINMHHHEALFESPDAQKSRFMEQWKQISEFFKEYPDSLLFELLNEPHGNISPAKWNTFLVDALSTIREDSPDRVVLIGTAEYGGLGGLSQLQLPNDQNIILTVHYYNPFQFTHQGAEWVEGSTAWLGTKWNDTETERLVMQNEFAPLKALEEQQHVPIHIGEFGAYSKADATSRKKWTTFLPRYLESLGWSWAYWEFSAGFGIYDPNTKTYNQMLVNALLNDPIPEPAFYVGTPVYTSDFEQGIGEWNLWLNNGAVASKQNTNNELAILINATGSQGWHIQLVKTGLQLQTGKTYRVTFTARSDFDRTITSYVGQNADPWGAYSGYNGVSLTSASTEYTYVFEMKSTDNAARLVFDLGTSAADVYFESIVLESVELQEPLELVHILSFETSLFPNPATKQLVVNNLDKFEKLLIQNLSGQILLQQDITEFRNEIDLSDLSSGIYFVSLLNNTEKFTSKIIKN